MFVKKLTTQILCNLDEPLVETPNGKLRGLQTGSTYIFRGVKYANARRFHMPEPVQSWDGVKDAIVYGFVCPEMTTPVPHDQYTVPHVFYPQHEDCQYLNIWTQSLNPKAKRPVMVWLHGGGFSTGSGIEHYAYDGEELSVFGNVVVVTLNHRLNVLGHLDLSAYGDEYGHSANAGMADIVMALKWIQENIRCFGGDPDQVTIFGQSGGGGKVVTLLQMPSADGLYHRAVVQSGVIAPEPSTVVQKKARELAKLVLEELNITKESIAAIETIPYTILAAAADRATERLQQKTGGRFMWGPVPDRDYVGYPFEVGFRKETLSIPFMCGTVFSEFTSNCDLLIGDRFKNRWSAETIASHMRERYGEDAQAISTAFEAAYPKRCQADALYVDTFVRRGTVQLAKQRAKQGCPKVYNYLFDLESPFSNGTLAWHNAEIPYVFHNAEYLEPSFIPGVTQPLQDAMAGAWVTFAETGDPNHSGLPSWSQVTETGCPTMIFNRNIWQAINHDDALLACAPEKRIVPAFLKKREDCDAPQGPQHRN